LLLVLLTVAIGSWQAQQRSGDWGQTLWVKIYPINASGSERNAEYIAQLDVETFAGIEAFFQREAERFGHSQADSVIIDLASEMLDEIPPAGDLKSSLDILIWSLKMRWWIWWKVSGQDDFRPDVRIFVRYHEASNDFALDTSLGMRKGMYGIVNAFANRHMEGSNNVVIAHEVMHTLGATDKYDLRSGQPIAPQGLAEPQRSPIYPQKMAEIMAGRIPSSAQESRMSKSLREVVVGMITAREIKLTE
jgi:hypothetical protein